MTDGDLGRETPSESVSESASTDSVPADRAAPSPRDDGGQRPDPAAIPVIHPQRTKMGRARSETIVEIPGCPGRYGWEQAWGAIPDQDSRGAWAHPGLATRADGTLLVVDAARPLMHVLRTRDGSLVESIPVPVTDIHGIAVDVADPWSIWIADQGVRLRIEAGEPRRTGPGRGAVLRGDLRSGTWATAEAPVHPGYRDAPFRPTSIALDPESDDVWVADGYGAHLVHRYTRDGAYRATLRPAGRDGGFDTPHAVFVDRRGPEPRVLVADRGNRCVRAFDLDGTSAGNLPASGLTSPSAFAALGDLTLVAELHASVAVLDPDGHMVGRIGEGTSPDRRTGWPNTMRRDGTIARPRLVAGRFNSPHAISVGPDGCVFVAEFVVGGRLVRLSPVDPD